MDGSRASKAGEEQLAHLKTHRPGHVIAEMEKQLSFGQKKLTLDVPQKNDASFSIAKSVCQKNG